MAGIRPLEGYRVADFGWVWAGTVLGHCMADMGAEVIKIESRRRLDGMRLGKVFEGGSELEINPFFHNLNRSKLSATIDIHQPEGAELAKRLVAQSDIVVENFSPGVMAKYGLDYQSLRAIKPDIIMVSLSAAGQNGPYADLIAYATIIHCLSGVASVVGYPDGTVSPSNLAYFDAISSLYGLHAALAALHHREQTGEGQHIDCSEWEVAVTLGGPDFMEYSLTGRVPRPYGNYQLGVMLSGNYRCAGDDQWVAIVVRSKEEWLALRQALGQPAWLDEFDDAPVRARRRPELDEKISAWSGQFSAYEATERLQAAGVPAAPALNVQEIFTDPHMRERESFVELEHPATGLEYVYGIPWKHSETPGKIAGPAPLLGQHNEYVFGDLLGLSIEERERLKEAKVLY